MSLIKALYTLKVTDTGALLPAVIYLITFINHVYKCTLYAKKYSTETTMSHQK